MSSNWPTAVRTEVARGPCSAVIGAGYGKNGAEMAITLADAVIRRTPLTRSAISDEGGRARSEHRRGRTRLVRRQKRSEVSAVKAFWTLYRTLRALIRR
jgi:hypothetical protein